MTYDWAHLPRDYEGVRRYFRAFRSRAKRWRNGEPFDWIGCIEGRHGDHRYHIHLILRDSQFSPAEVRYLWRGGEVDDEPVLRKEGGYRRLAEYFNKERPDGFKIPLGKHPWSCNLSLSRSLGAPEQWEDTSGVIEIPDDVLWARRGQTVNDFGAYYYASYILPKKSVVLF
ncbi:rolling circle replication-associated protein [Dysosmobacter sp.]|uniref:rolling circle replication-associated protein n=1 Tax=Dysosmobacter sp. TaxID=2591382 RepID=UPI003AB2EAE2